VPDAVPVDSQLWYAILTAFLACRWSGLATSNRGAASLTSPSPTPPWQCCYCYPLDADCEYSVVLETVMSRSMTDTATTAQVWDAYSPRASTDNCPSQCEMRNEDALPHWPWTARASRLLQTNLDAISVPFRSCAPVYLLDPQPHLEANYSGMKTQLNQANSQIVRLGIIARRGHLLRPKPLPVASTRAFVPMACRRGGRMIE
jgi:hypothetical protein